MGTGGNSQPFLGDPDEGSRRLYAGLYPVGLWSAPCRVQCPCGFDHVAPSCREAQRVAAAHDWAHDVAGDGPAGILPKDPL